MYTSGSKPVASPPCRPSQLFNVSHFSVRNTEKLGGPGNKATKSACLGIPSI